MLNHHPSAAFQESIVGIQEGMGVRGFAAVMLVFIYVQVWFECCGVHSALYGIWIQKFWFPFTTISDSQSSFSLNKKTPHQKFWVSNAKSGCLETLRSGSMESRRNWWCVISFGTCPPGNSLWLSPATTAVEICKPDSWSGAASQWLKLWVKASTNMGPA